METSTPTKQPRKIIPAHLPLVGVLLILAFFALIDTPLLSDYRSEETFGWMVVVWIPLAILLGLIQLSLWARWFVRKASPSLKKYLAAGMLAVLLIFLSFAIVRNLN